MFHSEQPAVGGSGNIRTMQHEGAKCALQELYFRLELFKSNCYGKMAVIKMLMTTH